MARDCGTASNNFYLNTGTLLVGGSTKFTCGAWVYHDSSGSGNRAIMSNYPNGTPNRACVRLSINATTDQAHLAVFTTSSHENVTATDITVPTNTWVFIGGRFQGSTELRCFVGTQKSTINTTPASQLHGSSYTGGNFYIGRDGEFVTAPIGGYIAEAFFLDDVLLSDNEMFALGRGKMDVIKGKFTDNASRYLPLHGNYDPEPDYSGNGHHGTNNSTTKANHSPTSFYTRHIPPLFESAAVANLKRSFIPAVIG